LILAKDVLFEPISQADSEALAGLSLGSSLLRLPTLIPTVCL